MPNIDREDDDNMDVELDMAETMNILADASSPFFRDIYTDTSKNIGFEDFNK